MYHQSMSDDIPFNYMTIRMLKVPLLSIYNKYTVISTDHLLLRKDCVKFVIIIFVEDDIHFLCNCPLYDSERRKLFNWHKM